MRSYGQFCALARTLDVIGDRWTLLIVRELLLRPCRYTDIRDGLPGIATNLLADRLRELESAGVVVREEAPPPVATTIYRLTRRGRALRDVVVAALRWGAALMAEPAGDDAFRSRWLILMVEALMGDADRLVGTIQLETGDEPVVLRVRDGRVAAETGTDPSADLTLRGAPDTVLGVLTGLCTINQARARGLDLSGDRTLLTRLRGAGAANATSRATDR
jgi:DNA-binding HxlR family transcriptional regulator